jgi:hypothetical protein
MTCTGEKWPEKNTQETKKINIKMRVMTSKLSQTLNSPSSYLLVFL